jgi:MFS family permease
MFIYFVGFNILEASLPSLVSRQANPSSKGTAMGIYSSSQFLGIFAGGIIAGVTYQWLGNQGIFIVNASMAFLWLIMAFTMKPQLYQLTLILPYDNRITDLSDLEHQLMALSGVHEVAIAPEESIIYLRINKLNYKEGCADQIINQFQKTWSSSPL